ncbi:phagocyte signaling impaired isoform X2 [Dermatophagoides farinae]|uniref:phagocyte signaling impaired isoform X2 n=1 Tax=Dermatophagoides farinae TaxID=6954 RepID=UPI003F60052C
MSRQQQPAENDRKLRPVFEYLDNGSYKKALQEIDKLLKKNRNQQYVRALKSLTLVRLHRRKESMEILNELHAEMPADEMILQTMSMCYREIQRNDLITTLYENALKKDSTNEKLFAHLFMSYVRMNDYKKQQITALNLYKVHQKNPYYFWAIMSIYMQAMSADDETMANKIILPLAEKMCEKFYKENRFESDSEYDLYLMVLEAQKNYSRMITIMEEREMKRKINKKSTDHFNYQLEQKAKLLRNESRLIECFDCYERLINDNNDQYEYYIDAFTLALQLDDQQRDSNSNTESLHMVRLLKLMQQMCIEGKTSVWKMYDEDKQQSNDSLHKMVTERCPRSPFIARIIIFSKLLNDNQDNHPLFQHYIQENPLINPIDLCVEYFENFGSKYVCIKDLIFILKNIKMERNKINELLMRMKFLVTKLNDDDHHHLVSDKNLNMSLCYNYIEHYCQEKFIENINDRRRDVDNFINNNYEQQHFTNNSSLIYLIVLKTLANTDIYQTNIDDDDHHQCLSQTIFDLIIIIESYLLQNRNDFYAKLILVCLYNAIGAAFSSLNLYELMEIKLIQNETLGYHFFPSSLHCALFQKAQQFLNSSYKFYSYNFKEASDSILTCYKNGCFAKIEEILNFNSKLKNSICYHLTFVERFFNDLLLDCKSENSFSQFAYILFLEIFRSKDFVIDIMKICDNRDLKILNPYHYQMDLYVENVLKKTTLEQEKQWLLYRYNVLKMIALGHFLSKKLWSDDCVLMNNNTNKESSEITNHVNHDDDDNQTDFDHLNVEMFENLLENSAKQYEYCMYCIEGPQPSRLITFFASQFPQLIQHFSNGLLQMFRFNSGSFDYNEKNFPIHDENLFNKLSKEIDTVIDEWKCNQTMKGAYKLLGRISVWIDVLNIAVSLFSLIIDGQRRLNKMMKKLKKRLDVKKFQDVEQFSNTFAMAITSMYMNIDGYFKSIITIIQEVEIIPMVDSYEYKFSEKFNISDTVINSVRTNVRTSYEKSLSEMLQILQMKQKYLSSSMNPSQ